MFVSYNCISVHRFSSYSKNFIINYVIKLLFINLQVPDSSNLLLLVSYTVNFSMQLKGPKSLDLKLRLSYLIMR